MKQTIRSEDLLAKSVAMATTLLILLLLAGLLLHVPTRTPLAAHAVSAMQVTLLTRTPMLSLPSPPTPPQRVAAPRTVTPVRTASAQAGPGRVESSTKRNSADAKPQVQLYTRDGRLRMGQVVDALDPGYAAVPPGATDARALDKARKLLERPNPVDYRETRFEKDWKSDGTLGDVAVQGLNRGMKRINGVIWGKDVEAVKARPSPNVRFNPALAENRADLGSEATGDAYKAAPIAHEDLPDLKGEGSRRIREQLTALEALSSSCRDGRRQQLLAPVRTHLADLQRAEHALAHAADPMMAEQILPRQADSGYDLARRALWYARRELEKCGPASQPAG